MTNKANIERLNSLLGDDGYLEDILLRSNSVDVPILLDLHGERLPVVISFSGLKDFGFVGGLSKGAIVRPELIDEGLRVFSVGVFEAGASKVSLVLSWENDRSVIVRATSARILFNSPES